MSRKNETMTVRGYDLNLTLSDIKREQPRSDIAKRHYGMPVTTPAFLRMLHRFWLTVINGTNPNFEDVWYVEFSKASLFRILAQEDCEFVRMYFVIPEAGVKEASIGLEGIDGVGLPISLQAILDIADGMNETTTEDIEISTATRPTGLTSTPPAHEEKGNGGPPFIGINNVESIKDFAKSQGPGLIDKTFKDFVDAYYRHAKAAF
jgi:hypothetical protein